MYTILAKYQSIPFDQIVTRRKKVVFERWLLLYLKIDAVFWTASKEHMHVNGFMYIFLQSYLSDFVIIEGEKNEMSISIKNHFFMSPYVLVERNGLIPS